MLEIFFAFLLAFILTYGLMPMVIRVSRIYGMMDQENDRASHIGAIPSLGGISIFIGMIFAFALCYPLGLSDEFRFLLLGLTVIFLVGARDDLDPLAPFAKLLGQLAAVILFVAFADIRLTSLYGLFDIHELSHGLSTFLSVLVYLFLINSYNLIDGINGLASTTVILATAFFGVWFYHTGIYSYSLLSFSVCGAVLAFLKYNITPAQIFMGDTGSLLLGAICTVLLIQFLEYNESLISHSYYFSAAPGIALSIVILPVFDTLRVFLLRMAKGISPFTPDRNHIHHLLLRVGLSHMQATSLLLLVNLAFVIIAIQWDTIGAFWLITGQLVLATGLTTILYTILFLRTRAISRSTR